MAKTTIPRTRQAADEDTWLRHLLLAHEVTRDKRLHPKALEGFVRKVWRRQVPWKHALSGRLKSLARNFVKDAIRTADQMGGDFAFRGAIFQQVSAVRALDVGTYDVLHLYKDPKDPAHAIFVRTRLFAQIPSQGVTKHADIMRLQEFFKFAPANSVELHRILHG